MVYIRELLQRLTDAGVEFVVVGGVAASLHGSSLSTEDLDVCIPTTEENVRRVLGALADVEPRLRMLPARPPLPDDVEKLRGVKNLYLITKLGQIDLLGELPPLGSYQDALRRVVIVQVEGRPVRVLDLDSLIDIKRSLNRVKDRMALLYLESLKKRKEQPPPTPE
ncbi:MAG: hypothetical protein ACREIT_05925 [Tepidisphaeraceae bacterium]